MTQKPVRKGSKAAKERMAAVRSRIGKKKKPKKKTTVTFKAKGKKISFKARK